MRKALISINSMPAGTLIEKERGSRYSFEYLPDYAGYPVSLTMPLATRVYEFETFPPFFDGLLPEGIMLEGLLKEKKIDRDDCFSQLVAVGSDMPGTVTVQEIKDEDMPDNL
jgi:serine/threonine-protein kinase HipA